MGVPEYQSDLAAAKAAIAAENWAEAESKLMQAQVELAGVADGSDRGGSLEMDRDTIEQLLERVQAKRTKFKSSGSGGVRRARVQYERPGGVA